MGLSTLETENTQEGRKVSMAREQEWLRKSGTDRVFPRTAILAERPDMFPVSHEDAMAIIERSNKQGAAKKEAGISTATPPAEAPKVDPLDTMDETALRSEAARMKVHVSDKMDEKKIRAKLKKIRAEDAEAAVDAPAPGAPQVPIEEPPEAPEPAGTPTTK